MNSHHQEAVLPGNHGERMQKKRKKVLYVDDDERTLNIVAKYLISNGFEVHTSTSPFVANLLEENKPDLVILDIAMPLLSGDKMADILLSQGYAEQIPILFFSGEEPEKIERISRRIPGSSYVTKQSGLDILVEKLRSRLS